VFGVVFGEVVRADGSDLRLLKKPQELSQERHPQFSSSSSQFSFPLLTLAHRLYQGKWLLDVTEVGRSAAETTKCTQLTAEARPRN